MNLLASLAVPQLVGSRRFATEPACSQHAVYICVMQPRTLLKPTCAKPAPLAAQPLEAETAGPAQAGLQWVAVRLDSPDPDFLLPCIQAALGMPEDQAAAGLHPRLDGEDSDDASDSLSDDMASMSGSSDMEHQERFHAAQTHGPARAQPSVTGDSASGLNPGKAPQQKSHQQEMEWEARTATDSDDESLSALDDRTFMSQYDEALGGQLSGTTLGQTFRPDEGKLAKAAPQQEQELQPVDVDMNLVQSMLQSYTAQQGLPGPASNLAGMLGLQLPDNADEQ